MPSAPARARIPFHWAAAAANPIGFVEDLRCSSRRRSRYRFLPSVLPSFPPSFLLSVVRRDAFGRTLQTYKISDGNIRIAEHGGRRARRGLAGGGEGGEGGGQVRAVGRGRQLLRRRRPRMRDTKEESERETFDGNWRGGGRRPTK